MSYYSLNQHARNMYEVGQRMVDIVCFVFQETVIEDNI